MTKTKISIITIVLLISFMIMPLAGHNAEAHSDMEPMKVGMGTLQFVGKYSYSWVNNPKNYEVKEDEVVSFRLVLESESTVSMGFTITPVSNGFTFNSLSTSAVQPGEDREVNISIEMPERGHCDEFAHFSFKINPSVGDTKVVTFRVYYVDSCGDYITGWNRNPSDYDVKAGKQATFEFIIKNRCDEENTEITISTRDSFIDFSNKKFTVLAGKRFTIKVTVLMPPLRKGSHPESHEWSFNVQSDSGVDKGITFSVGYDN
jgi:hypothetical protein